MVCFCKFQYGFLKAAFDRSSIPSFVFENLCEYGFHNLVRNLCFKLPPFENFGISLRTHYGVVCILI